MKTTKKQTKLKQTILNSDKRIAAALEVLKGSNRGQNTLVDLRELFRGLAMGLDSQGGQAVCTLVREFFMGGRRDFVEQMPTIVLPPKA